MLATFVDTSQPMVGKREDEIVVGGRGALCLICFLQARHGLLVLAGPVIGEGKGVQRPTGPVIADDGLPPPDELSGIDAGIGPGLAYLNQPGALSEFVDEPAAKPAVTILVSLHDQQAGVLPHRIRLLVRSDVDLAVCLEGLVPLAA